MKYQRLQMTTQSSLPFQTLTECKTSDIICVSLSTVTQSRDRKTMASSVQNKNKNEIISFTAKKIKEREKFISFFFQTHYGRRKERSRGKNRWMAPRESLMRQLGPGYAHLVYYTVHRYTHTKSIQESKMAVCCTIRRVGRAAALY